MEVNKNIRAKIKVKIKYKNQNKSMQALMSYLLIKVENYTSKI